MKLNEMVQGTPIGVQRSLRSDNTRALTSGQAGKILPLVYFPLLREDGIRSGQIACTVRMAETLHPLLNSVNVRLYAHLVPWSAFPWFDGMDDFNKMYAGTISGSFFGNRVNYNLAHDFWKTLGIHAPSGDLINGTPVAAYNTIVNFRRAARSKHLPLRETYDRNHLARAFWSHPILHDVVPDYEQALMDGEVPLSINLDAIPQNMRLPIEGIAIRDGSSGSFRPTPGAGNNLALANVLRVGTDGQWQPEAGGAAQNNGQLGIRVRDRAAGDLRPNVYATLPDIFAEMRDRGLAISLSNIELAKQTVAFAKLRQQYQGISEDHLVDLLMDGVRVPPESLRQPLLLGRASGVIAMTERHATDGENLDLSRTTGSVTLGMRIRSPSVNTGGIVMITAEITPEPLFERLGDKFLTTTDPDTLPQFLRDYLDPRKVEVVDNKEIDVLHGNPDGLFGYRGLNRAWDRDFTRAGGKFMRPVGDAFREDRQRFWTVETVDPSLTEDFYLVSEKLKNTPFADQTADPFEILTVSHQQIEGNTVFGKALHEDTGDYQAIVDRVVDKEDP